MALTRRKAAERSAATDEAERSPRSHGRAEGERLGDLLVARGLVNESQLAEALLKQADTDKRIGMILVELGAVSERDMVTVLSEQLEVPMADLRRETPESEVVALLPEEAARKLIAIPLRRDGDVVVVAVADPVADVRNQLQTALKTR